MLPGLATAMWLGLLASPLAGEWVPVPVWIAAAAVTLVAAALTAPRPMGRDPLAAIVPPPDAGRRSVEALAPRVPDRGRAPPWCGVVLSLMGVASLGIGWGSAHAHGTEGALVARIAPAYGSLDVVLRTDPRAEPGGWTGVADVRVVRAAGLVAAVREAVWVAARDEPPAAVRGDRLRVEGRLLVPDDPGFASFLRSRGISAELEAHEAVRLGPSDVAFIRWAQSFRASVGGSIRSLLPAREAGLLLGLSLGDDSSLDPALERDFRASGLSHLLVVSGGNVAMVLGPVLGLGALLRLSRWPRFGLGMGTVVFFVVLTGAEPSVLRAGVMAGLTLLGIVLGRPRSAASILCATVFGLLLLDPALTWSVGFQLSVAASAGMIALATPLAGRMRILPRPVALAAGATIAAQIGVTPLLLYHFHEVPLSTLVANVLAFPAVAPALLLGLAAAGAGLVWSGLGRTLVGPALVPLRYLEAVADVAARSPVPWITGGGPVALAVGLGLACAVVWWVRSGKRPPRLVLLAGLAIAPVLVWSSALTSGPPASLAVRFFDVGQGDAALLRSPDGVAVLVDGGPDPTQVATELSALGVKRLDVVIASHPHADHVVGLPAVLARFPVRLVLDPGCPDDSYDGEAFRDAIADEAIPVRHPRAGDVIAVGDVRLEVLSPDRCWTATESDANNDALVVRASLGEDEVLFATEPEEPAQQVLLDAGVDLVADVLKVPHHGAATSLEAFFDAIRPAVAVVSVGPNTYGHPVPEVLDWIRETGALVVRTDRVGDVVVTFEDGEPVVASAP